MNIFVSFADSRLSPSLKLLGKEVNDIRCFDKIILMTEKNLPKWYKAKYSDKLQPSIRGFGYWMWKSYCVKNVLDQMYEGDVLLYSDAGNKINAQAKDRMHEYIKMAESNNAVVFSLNQLTKDYTKQDLVTYLSATDDEMNKSIICATNFLLKKCDQVVAFVDRWYDICHNHFNLLDDSPSIEKNIPSFIEHRHDQSVFSILVRKEILDAFIIPQYEVYTSGNWDMEMREYPIWQVRRKCYKESYCDKLRCILVKLKQKVMNLIKK